MKVIDQSGRIFYHYDMWEDYKYGLYNVGVNKGLIQKSVKLLSNQEDFWDCMAQMRLDWSCSFEQNVSNFTQNRKAWLGQAACCYNHGASFNLTIAAWQMLSDEIKKMANETAQKMINLFEGEESNGKNLFRTKCFGRCQRTIEMDF